MLYTIPGRTVSNVEPDTIARLAENEFIVGVKEASGDIDQITQVIGRCPDDFFFLPMLAIGSKGSIAVNVLERAGEIGARNRDDIGIQTLRGGDNPGEHTAMFVGKGERIELIHRSATRDPTSPVERSALPPGRSAEAATRCCLVNSSET